MKKVLAMVLGCGFTFLAAQPETVPSIRVTSSRVLVEFLAVDSQGRFIDDLKPEELELYVDGRPVPLSSLIPPAGDVAAPPEAGKPDLKPRPGAPSQGGAYAGPAIAEESAPRTVILLDSRTLDANNFNHVVRAVRAFVAESLQAGQRVMLAEIDRSLRVKTPFTGDRETLLKALDALRPVNVFNPLDPRLYVNPKQFKPERERGISLEYIDELQKQVVYLESGLKLLCYSLSAVPGRKQIVFFSEGYPLDPVRRIELETRATLGLNKRAEARQSESRRVGASKDPGVLSMVRGVVSLANSFGIAFYTVDARGLAGVAGAGAAFLATDSASGPGDDPVDRVVNYARDPTATVEYDVGVFQATLINQLEDAQNTLVALAAGTNGSAFFNSNDLAGVLRASILEQRHVYAAAFEPPASAVSKFHAVRLKTDRPGVSIRAQAGYSDQTEEQLLSRRLTLAFENPGFFQGLHPVLEVSQASGREQAIFGVPGNELTARPSAGGLEVEVGFFLRIYDGSGKPVGEGLKVSKGFRAEMSEEEFKALAGQPLLAREDLELPLGVYKMVLAAVDRVSGAMGVASYEFELRP